MSIIASAWSGHDSSFAIFRDGEPLEHVELERWVREKEVKADSLKYLHLMYGESEIIDFIDHLAVPTPSSLLRDNQKSYSLLSSSTNVTEVGHHQCHAAGAFFSSKFEKATIVTLDGGGVEDDGFQTAFTIWRGNGRRIVPISRTPLHTINIGGLWTRVTRYIFKLQSGWPRGHAAGTVMAMAAFGDPKKYYDDFWKMLTVDVVPASVRPNNQPIGVVVPENDPIHPYLNKWRLLGEKSESELFDMAAGLQRATEDLIRYIITNAVGKVDNLCISGGVALNSVAMGKIREWVDVEGGIYIPPTPHDGGLTLGAAQYVAHHILDIPRRHETTAKNFPPYLGRKHDIKGSLIEELAIRHDVVFKKDVSVDDIVSLLDEQKIVAVFVGGSESGRRALGHRSILADPRSTNMKSMINDKVKHRQWFRPFAPSVLRERVSEWFVDDIDSPYMSFVLKFKPNVVDRVPAVVHADGTARLQTVSENDDQWYRELLLAWEQKTGVPMLLNTSFNDREPICETPRHALDCFMGTDIDYVYFADRRILVSKK